MAHFRGVVQGRSDTSRLGTRASGLTVLAQSWEGQIRVTLYEGDDGPQVHIALEPNPAVYGGDQSRKVLAVGSMRELRGVEGA